MTLCTFIKEMIYSEIMLGTQNIIVTTGRHSNNVIFNGKAMDIYYNEKNAAELIGNKDKFILSIDAKNDVIYITIG